MKLKSYQFLKLPAGIVRMEEKSMNLKKMTLIIVLVLATFIPATAEVFDIPATGAWIKVQEGEVTQWSTIPSAQPKTRIDLISEVENGKRISYFLIRSACADGTVTSAVIKSGNKIGIGSNCDGFVRSVTRAILDTVQKLPPEAAVLIKQ